MVINLTEKADPKAKRLNQQLKVVKKSLAKNPRNLNLLFQRGYILYQLQKYETAKNAFSKAIEVDPSFADGFNARSIVNHALGKFSDAIYDCERALKIKPKYKEALLNLARAQRELHQHDEALKNYTKAIALDQKYFNGFLGRALIWKILNHHEKALVDLNKAVSLNPSSGKALLNRGAVQKELGRYDESLADLQKAIALQPDLAEAHNNFGNTLRELGRLDEAEKSYIKAIALKPNYSEAQNNLGTTHRELGRLDEAETSYTKAIALKPNYAEAHNNLGNTLRELGRLDEAQTRVKQGIFVKPEYAEGHHNLAIIKTFYSQDEQYSKMRKLYLNHNISEKERCHINFGLAKACEDLGDFEQAFFHYREGNNLRKKFLNYDITQDMRLFKALKANYPQISKVLLEPDNLAQKLTPIFILGMPRSGTTLVEQIISSHPSVTGAGELSFISQFGHKLATGASKINSSLLAEFRANYFKKIIYLANGNEFITDKMPQNFRYIGLIATAFPDAKIVHVTRNSPAVCWANYKQYFATSDLGYTYSIADVTQYYRLYEGLMEFWESVFSNRFYNLNYEQLTVNQEKETKRLIDYIGLNWHEACLSPQDNKRSVATASNMQIRQKVYQGSSQKWKKYKRFLDGAFDQFL